MRIIIKVSEKSHINFAKDICLMMQSAAKTRGTGIAKRNTEYIKKKIKEGNSIIAIDYEKNKVVGFCYIENWEGQRFVANSGLIVHSDYRNLGLAKKIKKATFKLSKIKYPNSKLFGITTSLAVMKINSDLGYKPVTFSELPKDEEFWNGCKSCTNYDILLRAKKKMCFCTGMTCDLKQIKLTNGTKNSKDKKSSWVQFKRFLKYRKLKLQRQKRKYPLINKFYNEK